MNYIWLIKFAKDQALQQVKTFRISVPPVIQYTWLWSRWFITDHLKRWLAAQSIYRMGGEQTYLFIQQSPGKTASVLKNYLHTWVLSENLFLRHPNNNSLSFVLLITVCPSFRSLNHTPTCERATMAATPLCLCLLEESRTRKRNHLSLCMS